MLVDAVLLPELQGSLQTNSFLPLLLLIQVVHRLPVESLNLG